MTGTTTERILADHTVTKRLGNWTAADIKKALTDGVTPTGQHLSPPMPFPWFKNMTDQDLDAIVAYVQTLPPISNKVERTDFQKTAFK